VEIVNSKAQFVTVLSIAVIFLGSCFKIDPGVLKMRNRILSFDRLSDGWQFAEPNGIRICFTRR
jgi:hypothetical protein